MTDNLKKLSNYPDVSFIDNISFESLQEQMIQDFTKRYRELTGKDITLALADPYRLILYSCAVAVYQGFQYEDRAGKMGLLKYSKGEFLDNLAALKGVVRNEASPARTAVRFTLSAALSKDSIIPKGIRVKGGDLYYETVEQGIIPAGELSVDLDVECLTAGTAGNGYLPGDISVLVDPLPFTVTVRSIAETSGGRDRETDGELAERVYLAPASYSVAGPDQAYEYWVKSYGKAEISECRVMSEVPGEVDIYIMEGGQLPTEGTIAGLSEYLANGNIRPLTDHVIVKGPEAVGYEIEFSYHIRTSDRDMEQTIKKAVEDACSDYISWQMQIGRDITPAHLIYLLMAAGAQSVEVRKPEYKVIGTSQIGIASEPVIIYGGLRDG